LGAEFGEKQSQNTAGELAPSSTDNAEITDSFFSIAEAPSASKIKVSACFLAALVQNAALANLM